MSNPGFLKAMILNGINGTGNQLGGWVLEILNSKQLSYLLA